MAAVSPRQVRIATGLVALVLASAVTVFGIKVAAGALRPVYHLEATFSAAGQGLIRDSDVKIHGVNVGKVKSVKLVRGRARVRMEIEKGERVPVGSRAVVRPKTLFGEKFVDIDPGEREGRGPYLQDEDVITDTLGGFELERVLAEAYPILQAIDPDELATVVSTLAGAADGTGDEINRQIANFAAVARVSAAHDADTRQFLADLALLSDELARRSGDVVGLATDLNVALPELSRRGDQLATFLEEAARLSADLADVLGANHQFLDDAVTEGGKTLDVFADGAGQIPGTIRGFRQFFQLLLQAGANPQLKLPDGTDMVAVKIVLGESHLPAGEAPASPAPAPGTRGGGGAPALPGVPEIPHVVDLVTLVGGLLR